MENSKDSVSPFKFKNGQLFCEGINVQEFVDTLPIAQSDKIPLGDGESVIVDIPPTPFFLYSLAALKNNVAKYCEAIENSGLKCRLGYAVKANGNHTILKTLKDAGVEMLVAVSGNEVLAGIKAGFRPQDIILNGNGKQEWEIKLAIQLSTMLNVDSVFDAQNIANVLRKFYSGREVRVLLRIRPSSTIHKEGASISIHPYVNTAEASKFGFGTNELDQVLEVIRQSGQIKVHGIHCHLGSCIQDPDVYRCIGEIMNDLVEDLTKRGHCIEVLDIGGGIGIDYHKPLTGMEEYMDKEDELGREGMLPSNTTTPTVASFMNVISGILPKNVTIIMEPGRSLVAETGIVVCKVLGTKMAGQKRFVIVDASMAEVIRPCLYNAYHRIVSTNLYKDEPWQKYEVVGPICETADFLGHDILLQKPSTYLAIMDTGAYCSSMSSNYNMRPRPIEIMVDGTSWKCIRERDTFEDLNRKTNIV